MLCELQSGLERLKVCKADGGNVPRLRRLDLQVGTLPHRHRVGFFARLELHSPLVVAHLKYFLITRQEKRVERLAVVWMNTIVKSQSHSSITGPMCQRLRPNETKCLHTHLHTHILAPDADERDMILRRNAGARVARQRSCSFNLNSDRFVGRRHGAAARRV